ncbi:MAG TPA: FAD:protein FMN transferase [Propionicimonas sp.]|jgi:thiamine biosynthesis lipoprotein|uniref:FAD:protein FMN transferase n=1 Tax=Propionicimonas sp. TaxID=1955623 RepID=UPI002F42ECDA
MPTQVTILSAPREEAPRRAFVAQIMGLPMSIHVRGPQAPGTGVAAAVEAAFAGLRADEAMFSTWQPDSPVSRIKDGRDRLVDAHPRIRHVAALCELAGHRTGGAFAAWMPGADGRQAFDPTGLVKGWAVEQAFTALLADLRKLGPHDAMVCAGGDIAVACNRTDTPSWVVAVEDPRDRSRTLRSFELRTGAVATSGTAARGRHIVDPATGTPAEGLASATIIGPKLAWADVYATAAFVKGAAALPWIATLPDHAGILVGTDGTVSTISGMKPAAQATRWSSFASTE